jgi:hypothetical protein
MLKLYHKNYKPASQFRCGHAIKWSNTRSHTALSRLQEYLALRRQLVRKWLNRFKEHGYAGLVDLSRRPHHSPRATAQSIKDHIVGLQKKYRRLGAIQVKTLEKLPQAPKTIRKFWREASVASRRRRKKYIAKQNLREVKKKFYLFQQSCKDTKDLTDIPEYWTQMRRLNLPSVQYTRREVSCGILFTGFANELSLIHATLFAAYINHQMAKYRAMPEDSARCQTDNGVEFCGSWNAKEPSAYTRAVESLPGQFHTTIFPGARRMQADVETAHGLMETEFYEIETFADRADFISKANTYQLFFNLERPREGRLMQRKFTISTKICIDSISLTLKQI